MRLFFEKEKNQELICLSRKLSGTALGFTQIFKIKMSENYVIKKKKNKIEQRLTSISLRQNHFTYTSAKKYNKYTNTNK